MFQPQDLEKVFFDHLLVKNSNKTRSEGQKGRMDFWMNWRGEGGGAGLQG